MREGSTSALMFDKDDKIGGTMTDRGRTRLRHGSISLFLFGIALLTKIDPYWYAPCIPLSRDMNREFFLSLSQ